MKLLFENLLIIVEYNRLVSGSMTTYLRVERVVFTRQQQQIIFEIHIYIHTVSQDYGLISHTTHVVCVNFIREREDPYFNVDSERQIF